METAERQRNIDAANKERKTVERQAAPIRGHSHRQIEQLKNGGSSPDALPFFVLVCPLSCRSDNYAFACYQQSSYSIMKKKESRPPSWRMASFHKNAMAISRCYLMI
jgi:hypothetical protein